MVVNANLLMNPLKNYNTSKTVRLPSTGNHHGACTTLSVSFEIYDRRLTKAMCQVTGNWKNTQEANVYHWIFNYASCISMSRKVLLRRYFLFFFDFDRLVFNILCNDYISYVSPFCIYRLLMSLKVRLILTDDTSIISFGDNHYDKKAEFSVVVI